ncbi:MAG TPA: ATP-binding protein [Opitutaceae bacterium]|jgi:signal transduction histidine kinase
MNLTNLIAFIASLGVGCGVIYSNPKRAINRAFFLLSVAVAAWLLSLGWLTADPPIPNPVHWLRITSAIAASFPFLLWVIKDCVKGENLSAASGVRGWPWLLTAVLISGLCFTQYFIPSASTREHPVVGVGWHVYSFVSGVSYLILFLQAISELRRVSGIQKIELQTLIFGGAASGLLGILLMSLGPVLGMPALSRSTPVVIVLFYAFTAWAITTQKVFDARQLFRSGLRLGLTVSLVAGAIALAMEIPANQLPRTLVIFICAAVITLVFHEFNLRVLRATLIGGDREGEGVRASIIAAGRDEFERDLLIKRFGSILLGWARSERAYILLSDKGVYSGAGIKVAADSPAMTELQRMSWVTPESLQRQRDAGGRKELFLFMRKYDLGVAVCAVGDEYLAPFILALESRRDRSPFTWSEIKLLQEWATIIENTLSRISLTQQARESEQLRTAGLLGASLAHEIRNPLVTLKTIAQSASTRFNDPEFRRLLIELVPAEIERIEGLVSGLMDLGRPQYPHFEQIGLNDVVETSVKLVRPKALDESVGLNCALDARPDAIHADRASIRQIILNLVMNAIHAVTTIEGTREVIVRTSGGAGTVILEVADNGPGIPEEVRERLFQPFTTSNKTSGIGLGLAITADLVKLHQGKISLVDGQGVGTTFRVILPCQLPSS